SRTACVRLRSSSLHDLSIVSAGCTAHARGEGLQSARHSKRGATMKRSSLVVTLGIFVAAAVHAFAQAPPSNVPPTFTNLQVWPKDTSAETIMRFMNAFDDSLGITCEYCHVQRGGKFDFASDEKREKQVARRMILLRDSINVELPAIVGKRAGAGTTSVNGY